MIGQRLIQRVVICDTIQSDRLGQNKFQKVLFWRWIDINCLLYLIGLGTFT